MNKELTLGTVEVSDAFEAMELFWRNNWTDGLPIVPPTEEKVAQFLDYVSLAPDTTIAEVAERAASVTAEMVAVNAVMAGCLPEYMPVVIAAIRAVTDPEFHFNHLASLGSPWPLLIINGPIVKKLNFNSGLYLFGPGNRANATVGRAMSLILWNCLDVKPGGILRGCLGHPGRWAFCIAENEDSPWEPLHVIEGFDKNTSTVTAFPSTDGTRRVGPFYRQPKPVLDALAFHISAAEFVRGPYLVVINPQVATQIFAAQGWSKRDVVKYLEGNCRLSVADLKRISRWAWWGDYVANDPPAIEPGDDSRFIYLFHDPPGQDKYVDLVFPRATRERKTGIMVVVGGGNASNIMYVLRPNISTTSPVTKAIETPD
ncbi:MAG: hypothetical protein HYY32_05340 [Chloroflexi bacterium]|nr:hypothetical protein [Chloroflexota bacterium]